jgi:hypothetical protein
MHPYAEHVGSGTSTGRCAGLPGQDREWLQALLFTDAFSLVTSTPPPLRDCSIRGQLLRRLWAVAAAAAGRESEAVSWSRFTLDACFADWHFRLDHIDTLVAAGYIADAMKMLETVGEIEHPEGMFRAGRAALETGMNAAAVYWETMLRRRFPEDFRGFLLSARIALAAGDWKKFQENLENARHQAPGNPETVELEALWEAHQGRVSNVEALLLSATQPSAVAMDIWLKMARRIQRKIRRPHPAGVCRLPLVDAKAEPGCCIEGTG